MNYISLSNGVKIPQLGYGVYQIAKEETERCVLDALNVGYRHIDTAQSYFNEEEVGNAIKKSGIKREEIFITTKVWIDNFGYERTKESVYESMRKLQTNYIDLVLLHQPFSDVYGAWKALEDLYADGKIKAIGISNFYPDRVIDICSFSRIKPMVNQVETHPFNQQIEAQKWMKKYNVQIEAWAPFAEGRWGIFDNEIIDKIAKKHNKSIAQIIIRWEIQREIVVIPKSIRKERMEENFKVFDFQLDSYDMEIMSSIDKKESAFFSHTDPKIVEWFASIVEQRKTNSDFRKEKKEW